MTIEKINELETVLEKYSGKNILVALRGSPDPDSISSAIAHQRLLELKNIGCTVVYVEEVSHQENKALMKSLDVEFIRYNGKNLNIKEFSGYALVDSQLPDKGLTDLLENVPLISVIDHHDRIDDLKAEFIDIDLHVGSAATRYSEYFEGKNLLVEGSNEDSNLASALMHGIRTDTDNLFRGNARDYSATAYLSKFANLSLLHKVSIQPISPKSMETMLKAFQDMDVRDTYIIASAGIVRPSERDAIPQSADFLLRRGGIDTVLVYGIVGDNIDCSFRTTNESIRPAEFIEETFPEVKNGSYGGREDKGGFQLPLGIFSCLTSTDEDLIERVVNRYMDSRFYNKLGVKVERDESSGSE